MSTCSVTPFHLSFGAVFIFPFVLMPFGLSNPSTNHLIVLLIGWMLDLSRMKPQTSSWNVTTPASIYVTLKSVSYMEANQILSLHELKRLHCFDIGEMGI